MISEKEFEVQKALGLVSKYHVGLKIRNVEGGFLLDHTRDIGLM